jgi:hypothetical protein
MLSIFSTLREAFYLWLRNFWWVTVVTLVSGVPDLFWKDFSQQNHPTASGALRLVWFLETLLSLILNTAGSAAILGLLGKSAEQDAWTAIWSSIQENTWTLFRLFLLILLIVMIPVVVVSFLAAYLARVGPLIALVLAFFYFIFIKYALANPLVVVEKMNAWQALKRSWELTRGHFWYVGGCYLFIGGSIWMITWLVTSPSSTRFHEMPWPVQVFLQLIEPIWMISAWCMYLRIREVEGDPVLLGNLMDETPEEER